MIKDNERITGRIRHVSILLAYLEDQKQELYDELGRLQIELEGLKKTLEEVVITRNDRMMEFIVEQLKKFYEGDRKKQTLDFKELKFSLKGPEGKTKPFPISCL